MKKQQLIQLVKDAFGRWSAHKAPRMGASIAYYSLLSMAPLIILVIAIVGLVFDQQRAKNEVLQQARELIGPEGANTVKMLISGAQHPKTGIFASVIAIATLLFGASGVFVELRDSLNEIWDAPPQASSGLGSMVWQKLISFGMVLSVGFLLLISLILSAGMAILEKFFTGLIPLHPVLLEAINFLCSLLAITALIALIFKFVPQVRIDWKDVGIGAAATAVLFVIGKALLGFYLGTTGVGSAYGAAGSLVALVVWVYYSSQIFLFGAVFTREYALAYGSHANSNQSNLTPATGKITSSSTANAGKSS